MPLYTLGSLAGMLLVGLALVIGGQRDLALRLAAGGVGATLLLIGLILAWSSLGVR